MEDSNFDFRYVRLCDFDIPREKVELFANSADPDQTPHNAASDLGLHCLPISILGVSRLQWVKIPFHVYHVSVYAAGNRTHFDNKYCKDSARLE